MTRTLYTPTERALLASCRTSNEVEFVEALIEEVGPLSERAQGKQVTAGLPGAMDHGRARAVGREASDHPVARSESVHITQEDMQLWG